MNNSSSNNKLALVVLAAGLGSRYGGIKQIDGFGPSGETIMDYSLFDAIRAGFTKVIFIVREEILETVKERFLPKIKGKIQAEFVVQSLDKLVPESYKNTDRVKPYGTGHAVLCAQAVIEEPFVVINADDFYGKEAFVSIANHFLSDTEKSHAMVGFTLSKVLSEYGSVSRGVGERDANGYLKSVVERVTIVKENGKIISKEAGGDRELDPNAPTSMNFWGFHPSMLSLANEMFDDFLKENYQNLKSEFYIPLVVNEIIHRGKGNVKVLGGGNIWFGVTYQEDRVEVSQKIKNLVNSGDYPVSLWG